MTVHEPPPARLDPVTARPLLASLGFVANSDLPNGPGPAFLLVAIRPDPTFHHYDPERIDYWVTDGIHGARRDIARETAMPIESAFSWGLVRIVDRLDVSNEYLTFGGRLDAALIDDTVIAVFTSDAPILRRGGHSQGWDHGAACAGAFFARVLLAVDYDPGFEAQFSEATPAERYAAFVADLVSRYRRSPVLRAGDPELWNLLETEERRLRAEPSGTWEVGVELARRISPEESTSAREAGAG
jgi:hypothetical protein